MKLIELDEYTFANMPQAPIDDKNTSSKAILNAVYDNSLYTLNDYCDTTVGFINIQPTLITWRMNTIDVHLASPFVLLNDEEVTWSKKVIERLTNIQIEKGQKHIYALDEDTNLLYSISIFKKMLVIAIKHYKP